jgi:glucose dehydrogenase
MSDSNAPRTVNRRKLLQGAGAAAAIPVIGGGAYAAYAQATPQAVVDATPVASPAAGTSGDWATFGYDYGQTRHVPFTGITKENVGELGIAWSLDFLAEDESIPPANQSYPIVIDGVVYVTTTFNHVFALDAKTGDIKWHWAPENIGFFKNFGVSANRGVAVGDGSVFIMTLDMHIYKLDQATGEQQQVLQIWDVVPESKPEFGYYESTAPVYYNGVLYFGVSGSDNGVRGWFMAINGSDMSPAWPAPYYTVPPDGQDWRAEGQNHGGGAPWMPASIDTETNILYFVTGNPSPDFFGEVRPGNNPNTNSMIALDASTGEQIWVAQSLTRDLWDYDMAAPPILFTATIAGAPRRVVAEGSKAGQWWCWDAATGEVIYDGVPFAKIEHPDPTAEGVLVYPGTLGGSNYAPQSYDPTTNNYLICNIEWPSIVSTADPETVERRGRGDIDYGGTAIFSTDVKPYGTYVAISMENGEIVYSKETPGSPRPQPDSGSTAARPTRIPTSTPSTPPPAMTSGRSGSATACRPRHRSTNWTAKPTSPSPWAARARRSSPSSSVAIPPNSRRLSRQPPHRSSPRPIQPSSSCSTRRRPTPSSSMRSRTWAMPTAASTSTAGRRARRSSRFQPDGPSRSISGTRA